MIAPGKFGICGMRENEGGALVTHSYGKLIASHVDPIEKKPLYHFIPASFSFSVATFGCNFQCNFCQNWQISQRNQRDGGVRGEATSPISIVNAARKADCKSISYTYTEPTIFFEYALDIAKKAHEHNIKNVFVTNGYMTEEALDMIMPYLDAANVDLKSSSDDFYKKLCKARVQPVMDTIKRMHERNIWVEVTTLIIPEENDSEGDLSAIARFIASVSPDIPWHISRFRPEYEFTDRHATPIETLRKAYDIGINAGLKYVYMGNVTEGADTYCPGCGEFLVKRMYMFSEENKIKAGKCPACNYQIAGVW